MRQLKDFKVLKVEPDAVHIGHPNGKSIRIPRQGLSSQAMQHIQKMAQGGDVQENDSATVDGSQMPVNGPAYQNFQSQQDQSAPDSAKNAMQAYTDWRALKDAPSSWISPEEQANLAVSDQIAQGTSGADRSPAGGATGSWDNSPIRIGFSGDNSSPPSSDKTPAIAGNGTQMGPPAPAAQGQAQFTGTDPGVERALQEEKGANTALAKAQGNMGQEQAADIMGTQAMVGSLPTQQDIIDANKRKDDALFQAYSNDKINPNHYWQNKSTGAKVASGIGMILSGMGSGLTKQPNLAYDYINNAINRDIEAQKADQSKDLNLWKMNRESLGTDLAANLATQNQMYTGLKYQLMQSEASAQTPIAKARAQQANSLIDQKIADNRFRMSVLYPTQQSTGGAAPGSEQGFQNHLQGLQMIAPDYYKDAESKYAPGIGVAQTALTPEDRSALASYNELDKAITDAKNFTNTQGHTFGGVNIPFVGNVGQTAADVQAQSKRGAIVLELNNLHNLKRLNDHEYDTYMAAVGDPGAWRPGKALASFDELQNQVDRHKTAEFQKLGITPFRTSSQDQQAVQWLKQANPNDPNYAKVKAALDAKGVQY